MQAGLHITTIEDFNHGQKLHNGGYGAEPREEEHDHHFPSLYDRCEFDGDAFEKRVNGNLFHGTQLYLDSQHRQSLRPSLFHHSGATDDL